MNLSLETFLPIRLMVVNATAEASLLFCDKALRGSVFGCRQLVNLTLLVFPNELEKAQQIKNQLEICGFECNNGIIITSEIPSFSDADVFVFFTDIPNVNTFDFTNFDDDMVYDTFYLILKIANNLEVPPPIIIPPDEVPLERNIRKKKSPGPKPWRPLIVADGVVALDILKTFSHNLPNDIFFCPTPIEGVAKIVLANKLRVKCNKLNDTYVWAANDDVFHVDFGTPLYVSREDKTKQIPVETPQCEWHGLSKQEFMDLKIDFQHFSPAWLKKEFIQKVATECGKHPNNAIYKAYKISQLLQYAFKTRSAEPLPSFKANMGVISDGSLDTVKDIPYILPIIFEKDSYKINDYLIDDFYVKRELIRINKVAFAHHQQLKLFCKKFMKKNVIGKDFTAKSAESAYGPSSFLSMATEFD